MYLRQIDLYLQLQGVEATTIASSTGWDADRLDAVLNDLSARGLAAGVQFDDEALDRPFTNTRAVGDGATIRCEREVGDLAAEQLGIGIFPDWFVVTMRWPCRLSQEHIPEKLRGECLRAIGLLVGAANAPVVPELTGARHGPEAWIDAFARETRLYGFSSGSTGRLVALDHAPEDTAWLIPQASWNSVSFSAVPRLARRRRMRADVPAGVAHPVSAARALAARFPQLELYEVAEERLVRRGAEDSRARDILVVDPRDPVESSGGVASMRVAGRLRDDFALFAVSVPSTRPSHEVVAAVTDSLREIVGAGYVLVRRMGSSRESLVAVDEDVIRRAFW